MVNNRGEIFLKPRQHKVCHYKLGITDTADILNENETMMSFYSDPESFWNNDETQDKCTWA